MAGKTYNLTLNKNNNTSSSCTFTIPEVPGTYNLKLKLGSGDTIDAGNIVVDSTEKTYRLVLRLSDGTSIDAGTFTTPVAADPSDIDASQTQILTLYSGDEVIVSPEYIDEVGAGMFVISSDLSIHAIWNGAHFGYCTVRQYCQNNAINAPIEIYEFDGYQSQAMVEAQGNPELEASIVRDEGRYLGSIWVENGY